MAYAPSLVRGLLANIMSKDHVQAVVPQALCDIFSSIPIKVWRPKPSFTWRKRAARDVFIQFLCKLPTIRVDIHSTWQPVKHEFVFCTTFPDCQYRLSATREDGNFTIFPTLAFTNMYDELSV